MPNSTDYPYVVGVTDRPRRWRCTRGHEWENPPSCIPNNWFKIDFVGKPPEKKFCWLCLVELLAEHLGEVEEVPAEPAPDAVAGPPR